MAGTEERSVNQPQVESAEKPVAGPDAHGYFWGVGRRKTAVARVRVRPGEGRITINKRGVDEYFKWERDRMEALLPLKTAKVTGKFDVFVNARGGGVSGQASAVKLGLARALLKAQPDLNDKLREEALLSRDAREKERRKYGRRGARASFQFSKR